MDLVAASAAIGRRRWRFFDPESSRSSQEAVTSCQIILHLAVAYTMRVGEFFSLVQRVQAPRRRRRSSELGGEIDSEQPAAVSRIGRRLEEEEGFMFLGYDI